MAVETFLELALADTNIDRLGQTEIVESNLEMDINFRPREVSDVQEFSFVRRKYADPDHGDMLMEVYWVRIHRGGNLSVKILIHDNSNTHKYIYRSEHSQYIKDGGDLLLTGLNRAAILIDDTITDFWDLNLTNPSEHQPKRITNCKDCFDDDGYFFPINS